MPIIRTWTGVDRAIRRASRVQLETVAREIFILLYGDEDGAFDPDASWDPDTLADVADRLRIIGDVE